MTPDRSAGRLNGYIVALTIAAAFAVLTFVATNAFWGQGANDNARDRAAVRGHVAYVLYDAEGTEVERWEDHNTVNLEGLDSTFNLITGNVATAGYDGIAAVSASTATDDPSDGLLSTSIALTLDGDSGTGGDQNPADGAIATDFGTENGNGTVIVTFTANAAVTIDQIALTNITEDDTTVGGAIPIADQRIFAYIDVPNVSLGSGDSVQYTWTIDVD